MKEISVVIPVYNSMENLPELCSRLVAALQGLDSELILVNDGSRDRSWEVIKELARVHSFLTGVDLRRNHGQDNAIMAGLSLASGAYVVIMDDDLQHSPADVPLLLAKAKEGFDAVYARFTHKRHALWKRMGSWMNGKAAEWLLHKPPGLYLSPFQIIRGSVIQEIIKYRGPYPYVQGLLLNLTRNLAEVKVSHYPRFRGKSNFSLIRSMAVFFKLATSFSIIPLRIVSVTGMSAAVIGFSLAIYYLFQYFALDSIVEGWTTLVTLFLTLGGLILLSLGLIGEYLGRIYLTVNGKPQYAIRETVGRSAAS